ncbi:MAG: invasion associated locus B family protein [Alphaproteobacteria bacterium]
MRNIILVAAALIAAAAATANAQTASPTDRKFGDWAVACRQLKEDAPQRCVLFQNIILRQSGKRVLNVSIARPAPDKPYVAAVTAPLGILLPAGLTLQVDEKELVRFQLRLCNVNGCQGQFPVSDDIRQVFSDGKNGRVIFRQPNGRPLRVESSLNGFRDGFAELEKN